MGIQWLIGGDQLPGESATDAMPSKPGPASTIRRMMLRAGGADLFAKAFIIANLLGLVMVWSYSQRQEATRRKYEAIITSELANLQGRMSSLQQEAEENHAAIGQMKEAIESFIDSDNESHQKLMSILGAAQKELVMRPARKAVTPADPQTQPGGVLPQLDNVMDEVDSKQEAALAPVAVKEDDGGQRGGDILPPQDAQRQVEEVEEVEEEEEEVQEGEEEEVQENDEV